MTKGRAPKMKVPPLALLSAAGARLGDAKLRVVKGAKPPKIPKALASQGADSSLDRLASLSRAAGSGAPAKSPGKVAAKKRAKASAKKPAKKAKKK